LLCEATQLDLATVEIPIEGDPNPYRLCAAAAERLTKLALRPLEWYRLAVVHGPFEFYLHDDFYDDEGNAQQPDIPVDNPEAWPFPSLDEFRGNAALVFDFATAQFNLGSASIEALRELPQSRIQAEIEARYDTGPTWHHKGRMLEIASEVLGHASGPWFRNVISRLPADEQWLALMFGERCIPKSEGFDLAISLIPRIAALKARDACFALCKYNDARALGWIETHIDSPVVGNWGLLAACSGITWSRLREWIEAGRPRSLAALDALTEIARGKRGDLPAASNVRFDFKLPATPDEIRSVLESYLRVDDVPRVQQRVTFLLDHLAILTR